LPKAVPRTSLSYGNIISSSNSLSTVFIQLCVNYAMVYGLQGGAARTRRAVAQLVAAAGAGELDAECE
jgi:hypothetical protein